MAQQKDHIGDVNKMVEDHIVDTNKMITAVEWFYQRILAEDIKEVFEQAKAMEKEQIINAWLNGDADSMYDPKQLQEQAEQYYKETYGSNNQI